MLRCGILKRDQVASGISRLVFSLRLWEEMITIPTLEEIIEFLWITAQETKSDTQKVSAAKASFDCLLKLKGMTNNDSDGLTVVIEGGVNEQETKN